MLVCRAVAVAATLYGARTLAARAVNAVADMPDTDAQWRIFCGRVASLFYEVERDISAAQGRVATYIPILADVPPSSFALSVCTVQGQVFRYGTRLRQHVHHSALLNAGRCSSRVWTHGLPACRFMCAAWAM